MEMTDYGQINLVIDFLHQAGVQQVVICPGSRSAPLTLSISRSGLFQLTPCLDERTAGFIAIGMAQESKNPVAVVTTSGSAVANLYAAVTEAFFSDTPLILLTADRPPNAAENREGQSIFQSGIFGKHVSNSFSFPIPDGKIESKTHWKKLLISCWNLLEFFKPIHLNFHFQEPLYPELESDFWPLAPQIRFPLSGKKVSLAPDKDQILLWEHASIKLILVGRLQHKIPELREAIKKWEGKENVWIIKDPLSQLETISGKWIEKSINSWPKPDGVLSIGSTMVSKAVNTWIKNISPAFHFHFQEFNEIFDPWGNITHFFSSAPDQFLLGTAVHHNSQEGKEIENQEEITFGEEEAVKILLQWIPEGSTLHLGNSMSVRWAWMNGISKDLSIKGNRGTSGIDGCLSSAVGAALINEKIHTLIIGDLSFFYDSQALFIQNFPKNLRVIILNNWGGGIFRRIEGPSKLPECETLFALKSKRTARWLAHDAGIDYFPVNNKETFLHVFKSFWNPGQKGKIIEIFESP